MKSGRKVVKLAGEVSPEFDEEKIHKVRTTIKKIRAIGGWTGMPVKKFFRENYRLLGGIRDIQLVLSGIKKGEYIVPLPFTNWLESRLHHLKTEWQKHFDPEEINRQLKKLEKTFDENNQVNNYWLKFENNKNERMVAFMNERPLSDEQIHSGRKTIKEIDFLNKWEKKNSGEQMKKLSDETGDFMDKISAIKLLEQYLAEETDEVNKSNADLLLQSWKNNKDQEKIKLLESIDSLSR